MDVAKLVVRALVWSTLGANCTASGDPAPPPIDDAQPVDDASSDAPDDVWRDPSTLPDGAPSPCVGAMTCDDCTSRTPCGWCAQRCLAGTETGSFDGTCSGAQWSWRGVQCPGNGTQCATHSDCGSCAADENSCGWCTNVRRCVAGDRSGPADTTIAGCSPNAATWIYNLSVMACP